MLGQSIGSYQILKRLGEGGMGVVYEAVHTQIKRHAAIKLLHAQYSQNPQIAQRFLNEAKAVNIVKHPGLVEVFEYGQLLDKTAYIVMEYIAGESLKQVLDRHGGSLSVADSLRWTRQIAGTLAAAHACGVIHRDLKPDNVMIVEDPQAEGGQRTKVLDFGIAKLASEHAEEASSHTETGLMMGTPAYMSPEQCLGAGRVDDRADVYSLGVMLYQMLAGRVPFVADGKGALILMHMTQKPPPLRQFAPQVPESLVAFSQRMLAKKKEERPSMTEVVSIIAALEGGRLPARSRQRVFVAWASCGLLALTGSGLAIISRHPTHEVPSTKPLASAASQPAQDSSRLSPQLDSPIGVGKDEADTPKQATTRTETHPAETPPAVIPPRPSSPNGRPLHRRSGKTTKDTGDPPASNRKGLIERELQFE